MTTRPRAADDFATIRTRVEELRREYVGGRASNRKNYIPPKAPVLSLVERDGRVRSFHVQTELPTTNRNTKVGHGLPDAMPEEPCGFQPALQGSLKLAGADALLRRTEQVDGLEPRPHRKRGWPL